MSFSTQLHDDYDNFINGFLQNISVERKEDCETITRALQTIINPELELEDRVSAELAGRITPLKELLSNPGAFVQDSENFPAFQRMVMDRVAAKIKEINTLRKEFKNTESSATAYMNFFGALQAGYNLMSFGGNLFSALQTKCEKIANSVLTYTSSVNATFFASDSQSEDESSEEYLFFAATEDLRNDLSLLTRVIQQRVVRQNAWNNSHQPPL